MFDSCVLRSAFSMAPRNPFSWRRPRLSGKTERSHEPKSSTAFPGEVQQQAVPSIGEVINPGRENQPSQNSTGERTCSSVPTQQRLLDYFSTTFPETRDADFPVKVQTLKGYLYKRDFQAAFGDPDLLRVYAARWSPTRALAYSEIFLRPVAEWARTLTEGHHNSAAGRSVDQGSKIITVEPSGCAQHASENPAREIIDEPPSRPISQARASSEGMLKVTCLGAGGGAELMALMACLEHYTFDSDTSIQCPMTITLIDSAPWLPVLRDLMQSARILPIHPVKNSEKDRSSDETPTTPTHKTIHATFKQRDLLSPEALLALTPSLEDCHLVTLAFTLNELFTTSRSKTTLFLLQLTDVLPKGALLLIIDSPGSYSTMTYTHEISVRAEGEETEYRTKQYPMLWLLERCLFDTCLGEKREERWQKVQGDESRWFRLDSRLQYPIKLEDMRYQMHLYRRI